MEITGLKELKKLMKGDARNKFEFEEDNEANGSCFDNNYLEKLKKKGVPETYQTFKNS